MTAHESGGGKELSELHPLPWRAYKTWVFDANNNHVIDETMTLTGVGAEFIAEAVNNYDRLSAQVKRYREALEEIEDLECWDTQRAVSIAIQSLHHPEEGEVKQS